MRGRVNAIRTFKGLVADLRNDTLDLLPERTREIFIMSRIQNLPHKEIAEKLNISYKSVEFHITKALRELRIQLKDYLPFFIYFLLK